MPAVTNDSGGGLCAYRTTLDCVVFQCCCSRLAILIVGHYTFRGRMGMRTFYACCLVIGAILGSAFSTTPQDPRAEVMVASVYHDSLHGCITAYGELYDKEAYTVAHKTIPNGSIVIIANPQTNRFLVAVVNDRGPFVEGRDIDLSARVARELEFEGVGPLLVEVVNVPIPSNGK